MGFLKDLIGVAAPIVGQVVGGPAGAMIGGAIGKAVGGGGGATGGQAGYAQAGGLTTPGAVSQGTVQTLPDWYTNYAKTVTNNALGMMGNLPGYGGYVDATGNPAPMVAGLSGTQQQGINTLKSNVGTWQGGMTTAKNTANSGVDAARGGLSQLNQASPLFNQASAAYGNSLNTIGNAQNMIGSSGATTGQSLGTVDKAVNTFGQGQAQINSASGALNNMGGALNKASGYLDPAAGYIQAGTNGSEFSADKMSQYMNPYTKGVTDEIARLGNQNLMENVLPGVNSTFTGAGQFGSTRNGDFVARALRDNQATITGQQAKVLSDAQSQALQLAQGSADRQLQAGAQTGQLSNIAQGVAAGYGNQAGQQINQGQATLGVGQGQLGAAGQQLAGANTQLAGANTALNAAQGQQAVGAGFNQTGNNQINLGQAQGQLGTQLGGLAQLQGGLTQAGQQMGLGDAAALMNAGAVEQATNQKGMDAAYRDFLDSRDYPLQALGALSQIMPAISGKVDGNSQTMTLNSANAPAPVSRYQAYADLLGGLSVASMGAQR